MQPEVEVLLKKFDEMTNDCTDALLAWGVEKDPEKKNILLLIYEEKDKARKKVAQEMYRLTNI